MRVKVRIHQCIKINYGIARDARDKINAGFSQYGTLLQIYFFWNIQTSLCAWFVEFIFLIFILVFLSSQYVNLSLDTDEKK